MENERICPICNKSFKIPTTRKNQIYCSRDCSVIGRRSTKEETAKERVNDFIESLPDMPILDVLEGRFNPGTTDKEEEGL